MVFTVVVTIILWIRVIIATNVLYVLPDNSNNVDCPSQPCYTLTQYLEQNGTLPIVSDVEYYLLSGEHYLPSHTILSGLYNFSLVGTAVNITGCNH